MVASSPAIAVHRIEDRVLVVRGQKVLLDSTLAELYEVPVKALNQAVRRNANRFPPDFMFSLTAEDVSNLRSQFVTSSLPGWGGRRSAPYAFTEQGVAMLSSVLRSDRAAAVNVEIMRAFVRLRQILEDNSGLARKLAALEKKYDARFKVVFEAIRELMKPQAPTKRPIGFVTESAKSRRVP
jgi:hypothetical protein